jgi:type II secretory pathway component PulK
LSYGVRQKVTLVKRLDDRNKLQLIADAGVKEAIVEIKLITESDSLSSNGSWSVAKSAFKESFIGDGKIRYALIDEERKININKAKLSILEDLFIIILGLDEMGAQDLAASIIDWRDEDSMLSIPLGSAEDRDYKSLQYSYEAKDQEFEVLDEILLVKGMTTEIFEKVKDYITIYGDGKVNINTASKEILLVLGLDEAVVNMIRLYRRGEDGLPGTEDDNVFAKHSSIVPSISQFYHLSDSQLANLTQNVQYLVTNSSNFTVTGIATLNKGKISSEVGCVIDRDGAILYWHET